MPRKYFIIAAVITIIPNMLRAQSCPIQIGTNLAGPSDWGTEWPFADIMKYSRQWITFNSAWVPGGENPWDTEALDQIPVDEQGYPLELPWSVAGEETTQVVRTVWANTWALKEGIYTVLYDGDGVIDIGGDGLIVSRTPGRITFDLIINWGLLELVIAESKAENHIRNIRVLLPGTESSYQEQPWCPEWLDKLDPFTALRFMDWGLTNNSTLHHWEDRPHVDDYTYTLKGVPYEWWIRVCNLKQADAWICIPHQADDDYIRHLARLFRDNLDPDLKLYVEYSNEIWNWIFDQTDYLYENGDRNVDWPERIVPFVQHALDIFSGEFAGQMDRIVRAVGVQTSWQDVSNRVVFNMRSGSFDAVALTSYFSFTESGYDTLETLGTDATADDVLRLARQALRTDVAAWIRTQHRTMTKDRHIPIIYYEGGQHLTPEPFGTVQPYSQALMDAQIDPGMYDLYNEMFDSLEAVMLPGETTLWANFSFISDRDGQYGSWGVLESQFHQSAPYLESAPKYQVILDRICTAADVNGTSVLKPENAALFPVSPNPLNGTATIRYALKNPQHIRLSVCNLRGQTVAEIEAGIKSSGSHIVRWDTTPLPSGIYLIRLNTPRRILARKLIVIQ